MVNKRSKNDFDDEDDFNNEPEIEKGFSAVAVMPGRNILIIVIILTIVGAVGYYTFFSGSETEQAKPKAPPSEISSKIETVKPVSPEPESVAPVAPTLPEPPPLVVPTPPPPPPPPPPPAPMAVSEAPRALTPFAPEPPKSDETLQARRKSGIMLGGGGGGADATKGILGKKGEETEKKKGDGSPYFIPEQTDADQEKATRIGHTDYVIAQGKIIEAILETAINTDLDGVLRAIVSRDVYAESGRHILVPKGSRLIGNYKSDVKRGQRRVDIIWTRVIRPDGIDVMIDSPGIDQLGRMGIEGEVDNKYLELFANSVLLSTITTGFAIAAEHITDGGTINKTQSNDVQGNNTASQTGKSSDFAIADATQTIGNVAKQVVNDAMQTKPTITVDQGTRVKVFVNRDLIFPENIASRVKVIR